MDRLASRLDRLSPASLRINVALSPAQVAAAASDGAALVLDSEAVVLLVEGPSSCVLGRTSVEHVTTTAALDGATAAELIGAVAGVSLVHAADAPWTKVLSGTYDGPWTVVPVQGSDAVIGLIAVPAHAEATDEDRMLLRRVAEEAAVGLGNLSALVEDQRTALTVQRSLLPATLPPLPGLAVAARYQPSGVAAEAGGDFFDTFQTDDGRSVVVIGDVQGHSLEAAIVMGELRYSLRAYVHDGHPATEVLNRLNSILLRGHPDLTATICILVVPEGAGDIEVTNAGHIPPLVVRDGHADYLHPTGTLLGIETHHDELVGVARVPGTRLVLMTDGVVERRHEALGSAMDRFADEVTASTLSAELLCDQLMDHWSDGEDDVCLIVLDVLETAR